MTPPPSAMSPAEPGIVARLDELERQITEIRKRLAQLEHDLATRTSHPVDQTAVREKVTFDWQS
ncbi:MAG TPA: hypothetical protein VEY07_06130 [Thermoplasmata archaeon]|nr:hypothetical protein [Thermoplasmata archaeon]